LDGSQRAERSAIIAMAATAHRNAREFDMMKRLGVGMIGAAALLAGCQQKTPQGQVAATVNGDEVTLQEINAEIGAANLPPNVDKKEAQRAMLQRVIDRKLLVSAAEDKGLDKTAEFMTAKRRVDETLVAQAYAKQQLAAVPVPSEAEVKKFMDEHANVFLQREQLVMDQIRFAAPKDVKSLRALEGDHSMDAVAAHLTQMGIKFERGPAGLDSGQAPTPLIKAMNAAPATEPFVIPSRGIITVNVITARRPIAIDPQQSKSAAVQAWRQQKFEELLNQQVTSFKNAAKITYQKGFAPPATPATPAGTPAATPAPAAGSASSTAPAPSN
jgi:EpsD family peptidyl-prolyl cis-trans isomerase